MALRNALWTLVVAAESATIIFNEVGYAAICD
jgi:hypothetical protein